MTSPGILLRAWNFKAKKGLGQNFILNQNAGSKIVELAEIRAEDSVLEIGAGLGGLTIFLGKAAREVYAVEIDSRLIDLLRTELSIANISNVKIINKNILKLDIKNLAKNLNSPLIAIGNLPYNISSQIIVMLIEARRYISKSLIMLQKETGTRLACEPGTKNYGRLTVMLRYCADIKKIRDFDARHFLPKPKVESSLIQITFKEPPKVCDEKLLFKIIKAGFSRRRKTIKNSLSAAIKEIEPAFWSKLLKLTDIDPARRAETLNVDEFVRLTNQLYLKVQHFDRFVKNPD